MKQEAPPELAEVSQETDSTVAPLCFGYIYKTTDSQTGMIYIGQHVREFDSEYLGSGVRLAHTIKKYGRQHFSVKKLLTCGSKAELNDAEIRLIRLHRKLLGTRRLYNIASGGNGNPFSMLGRKHSEETKRKISGANKGTVHSSESIERWKKSRAWYRTPEETKQALSDALRRFWTPEQRAAACGKTPWNKGLRISPEVDTAPETGRHKSPEHRQKLSEARRRQPPVSEEVKTRIALKLIKNYFQKIGKHHPK